MQYSRMKHNVNLTFQSTIDYWDMCLGVLQLPWTHHGPTFVPFLFADSPPYTVYPNK